MSVGLKLSHKKRKDSLETRPVIIEISILCWSLPRKRTSYLKVTFVLIWMKQTLIWFTLQGDGTGNRFSNIRDTFAEGLQLQVSVLHQSM